MGITEVSIEQNFLDQFTIKYGQDNNIKSFVVDSVEDITKLRDSITAYLADTAIQSDSKTFLANGAKQLKKGIDWEQRRYEIARDLYTSFERKDAVTAIKEADGFIKELKGESK